MPDYVIEALSNALRAWDTYEPDVNVDRLVRQANAMAEAIRIALKERSC